MDDEQVIKENGYRNNRYLICQLIFFAGTVVINYVLPRTVSFLNLPLYLDSVGTLLAAILGG